MHLEEKLAHASVVGATRDHLLERVKDMQRILTGEPPALAVVQEEIPVPPRTSGVLFLAPRQSYEPLPSPLTKYPMLLSAVTTSRLAERLGKFEERQRPWYKLLRSRGAPVAFRDITRAAFEEVGETFVNDVFERFVQVYLAQQEREKMVWFSPTSSDMRRFWKYDFRHDDHVIEFSLQNQRFLFPIPTTMIYDIREREVKVRGIIVAKLQLRSEPEVDFTISQIGRHFRALDKLNTLPLAVASAIFMTRVNFVNMLENREDRIFVPSDCRVNHRVLQMAPVSREQLEMAVSEAFNIRFGYRIMPDQQ